MKIISIKSLAVVGLLTISLSACDTNVIPPADIAAENYWKTQKDAWYALNACYASLPGYAEGMIDEMSTDNAHSHKPWEGPAEMIQQGDVTAADVSGYDYTLIRKAANYIANVDNCNMSDQLKERTKAEARFFRAMQYLNMVVKFGGVPLVTEVLAYDAPYQERTDLATVQKYIISELAAVAEILPDKYAGGYFNETGRITRAAALALEARAALYFGDYATAEKAAKAVITEGHHSLFKVTSLNAAQQKEADEMGQFIDFDKLGIDKDKFVKGMFSYEGIWQGDNCSPSNPEYILTHEYMADADGNVTDWARYQYARPSQLVTGYSSYEPMQDLVDAYWNIDGKTHPAAIDADTRAANFTVINAEVNGMDQAQYIAKVPTMNLAGYSYMQEFRNRDSRMYASILFPFKGWHVTDFGTFYYRWNPKKAGSDGNESWTGFSWRKMVATRPYDTGWGENYSYDDFPLIRYAEVLLIAAEAHVQNTGYDATVCGYLNQLRDRCGMPDVPSSFSSKDEALKFVRNERRIELAGEGQRYVDMRRYGSDFCAQIMSKTTYAPNKYVVVEKNWNNNLMLMPIPQSAIDMNPKLTQNSGY